MPAEAPPAPAAAAPAAPATPAAPAATPPASGAGASSQPASKPAATKTAPVSKPSTDLANAYDQLDKLAAGGETETPESPSEGDEPGDGVVDQEPAAGDETLAPPGDNKPVKAKTLRQTLEALKLEHQKLQTQHNELKTAKTEVKADPEKEQLRTSLSDAQKRLNQLDEELRFTNYERSTEYKEKWEAPFIDAYEAGRNKVASFKLANEDGTERAGTAQDFDSFMRITDDNDAAERAVELFGNKAAIVMYHREQAQRLNSARLKALDEYRKTGGEREKTRSEAATKRQQQLAALWEQEAKSASDNPKFASWFKAPEGDDAGKEILERGFSFADEAFGKPRMDENGKAVQRSPEDVARMHAVVRNKAAGFDYQVYRNQKLQKELRDTKKKLAEFEKSVPGPGNGRGQRGQAALSTWDAIDADLARRAR